MSPLTNILHTLGIQYHCYADDSQIYVTFIVDEAESTVSKIEEAVATVKKWMAQNFLCMNDGKTEVLLTGSKSSHQNLNIPHIIVDTERE